MKLKQILPLSYLGIWLIIFFVLPKDIFYSGTGIMRWLVYIMIFFVLPYLLYNSLALFSISNKVNTIIAYLSVFLVIPFAIWLGTQSARELKNNGSETYGIIHKAWYSRQKSKADVWSIQAKYLVNNKLYYTSTKQNPNKTLFVGDTVTIIYSKNTPQMSEILELIQEY